MPKYIDVDAFVEKKREQYCAACERRMGVMNGKAGMIYEIGDAPCRACWVDDMLGDVEDFPAADVRPWISVEERLPEGADESGAICENVWLLFDDGGVYPGWMNGTTKKVYYLDDMHDVVMRAPISRVRAWQQRPTPPEEALT